MTTEQLISQIQTKKSFLCIGLDVDLNKIPIHLLQTEDPIFEFNKAIIDATHDLCVSYKPNTAFYEAYGIKGWQSLEKTINYINENYPEIFTIADAKRGDIGNTSEQYAKAFLNKLNFDSITVAPYMGEDSVKPFILQEGKWVIVLALTSNIGSNDFQMIEVGGKKLYEIVTEKVASWGTSNNTMFVVGATHPEKFASLRNIVPHHFFLVPGVGAQGGDLKSICNAGLNNECGLLVNSSRGIIYASTKEDFAERAAIEAQKLQQEMEEILIAKGII